MRIISVTIRKLLFSRLLLEKNQNIDNSLLFWPSPTWKKGPPVSFLPVNSVWLKSCGSNYFLRNIFLVRIEWRPRHPGYTQSSSYPPCFLFKLSTAPRPIPLQFDEFRCHLLSYTSMSLELKHLKSGSCSSGSLTRLSLFKTTHKTSLVAHSCHC